MPTTTVAGRQVELNDEGFFTDPDQWSDEMAPELAATVGVDALTEDHWKVIEVMRSEYAAHGTGPSVRALGKISGYPVKRLYELFPKGPAKSAAKVAGIPKPRGCI
jgi:tRNA 2-thiouridine synthesizing protein E